LGPADPRLGPNLGNNGSNAGGVQVNNGFNGPDAPTQAILDYTVTAAPNTTYTFSIGFESLVYDNNTTGSGQGIWRNGMQFHIGNSAEMEYGAALPSPGGFVGPWTGDGGTSPQRRNGTQFHAVWGKSWDDTGGGGNQNPADGYEHGVPNQGNVDYRGQWHNSNPGGSGLPTVFTQRQDRDGLGIYPMNWTDEVTTGPDGKIVFRTGLRLKSGGQPNLSQVTFALDNLRLVLVPEPTSLMLLAAGTGLVLFRRRRGA
jgi:hypothetical protein